MSREQGGELSTSNLEKMQFTRFILVFAARLFFRTATFTRLPSANFEITFCLFSRRQFTCFRGADFEIAVYSFSPPKPFPIDQNPPKMLPHNPPNASKNAPQNVRNREKLSRATKRRKVQKKEAFPNQCNSLGPLFSDFLVNF